MVSEVVLKGWLSLYHSSVSGSSPLVIRQETWIGLPADTNSGKSNGRISGGAKDKIVIRNDV